MQTDGNNSGEITPNNMLTKIKEDEEEIQKTWQEIVEKRGAPAPKDITALSKEIAAKVLENGTPESILWAYLTKADQQAALENFKERLVDTAKQEWVCGGGEEAIAGPEAARLMMSLTDNAGDEMLKDRAFINELKTLEDFKKIDLKNPETRIMLARVAKIPYQAEKYKAMVQDYTVAAARDAVLRHLTGGTLSSEGELTEKRSALKETMSGLSRFANDETKEIFSNATRVIEERIEQAVAKHKGLQKESLAV